MAPPASGAATPGHCREPIVAAIQEQAASLDFCAPFQFSHPKAFQLASRIAALAPGDLDHVFFTNSGSEAVDTALKIAAGVPQCVGAVLAAAADRARARLSRRRLRRHGRRRHRREPQGFRAAFARRRPPAYDLQPRAPGLQRRRAGLGRPPRRRPRPAGRPARFLDDRGGDRRADGRVDGRAASAQGLSATAAYALRQAWNPADLRRGDFRLRAAWFRLRRRTLRRGAGHDHLRQGCHLGHGPDGRRHRAPLDPRPPS